jgi:hypothetical protein
MSFGATGERFFYEGRWYSSDEAAIESARLLATIMRPKDNLEITRYIPIEGTPLAKLHKEGKIIKSWSSDEALDEHIKRFISAFRSRWHGVYSPDIKLNYELALRR